MLLILKFIQFIFFVFLYLCSSLYKLKEIITTFILNNALDIFLNLSSMIEKSYLFLVSGMKLQQFWLNFRYFLHLHHHRVEGHYRVCLGCTISKIDKISIFEIIRKRYLITYEFRIFARKAVNHTFATSRLQISLM